MRIAPKPAEACPWHLRPFFWNQRPRSTHRQPEFVASGGWHLVGGVHPTAEPTILLIYLRSSKYALTLHPHAYPRNGVANWSGFRDSLPAAWDHVRAGGAGEGRDLPGGPAALERRERGCSTTAVSSARSWAWSARRRALRET
jgi:hypothetical protein